MGERSIKLTAVILAQLFIFPLLFGHSYVYPNWAINYRVLSVILILAWFGCFLFGGQHYLKFKRDVEHFLQSYPRASFAILALFVLFLYTYCVVDSFLSFGVNAIDFSFFNELIPNTLSGRWMHSDAYGGNHFGVHSTWIMLLFTPFYLVTKSPLMLVVSHALILVSTIFPLKKMLDLLSIKRTLSYFFILAFFLSSYMAHNLNYNFHIENFMIPLNRGSAEYLIASTAGAYGGSLSEIIGHTFAHPVSVLKDVLTSGWKKLLLPYLGLPALSLSYWGFTLVAIYVHAMATSPFMKYLGLYYSAPFISATFAGFVITLLHRKWFYERREVIILLSAVLLMCVGNGRVALERAHPYYFEFAEAVSEVKT